MKIDFVVTWVDGNDPEWIAEKNKFSPGINKTFNTNIRYRDYGLFKYWFRSIEKYAPWVNKIYVVTSGQKPEWLNIHADKIVFVKHSDFIPEEYLPTFNSNAIELNLHRIKGLSENFVLFNDDMYLINDVTENDFFYKGLPRKVGIYSPVIPFKEFSNTVFNNVRIINKNFDKRKDLKRNWKKFISFKYGSEQLRTISTLPFRRVLGYKNLHLTSSHTKSVYREVWDKEFATLDVTSKSKFRSRSDVNHWLFSYWQIEKGFFYPQSTKLGYFYTLNEFENITNAIVKGSRKIICINDDYDVENYEDKINGLIQTFEKVFSDKSEFEL